MAVATVCPYGHGHDRSFREAGHHRIFDENAFIETAARGRGNLCWTVPSPDAPAVADQREYKIGRIFRRWEYSWRSPFWSPSRVY